MSELKKVVRYSRDFGGNLTVDPNGSWVLAADAAMNAERIKRKLDAAQSELAALREELALTEALLQPANDDYMEWRKRAECAEQRNAELVELLRETLPPLTLGASTFKSVKPVQKKVRAALNPTESGASE